MDDFQIDQLAESHRRGDRDSFRLLVETLTRELIARAWRYTGDWEIARDLCQETWIRVYEKIHRYDPRRPFRPWLMTLHRNSCISWMRREKHHRAGMKSLEREEGRRPADPGEKLGRREFIAQLRRAMQVLSESQQRVFALVDLEETSQDEAAHILGMKPATLRSTLHFARRRLAERLGTMEDRHEA